MYTNGQWLLVCFYKITTIQNGVWFLMDIWNLNVWKGSEWGYCMGWTELSAWLEIIQRSCCSGLSYELSYQDVYVVLGPLRISVSMISIKIGYNSISIIPIMTTMGLTSCWKSTEERVRNNRSLQGPSHGSTEAYFYFSGQIRHHIFLLRHIYQLQLFKIGCNKVIEIKYMKL